MHRVVFMLSVWFRSTKQMAAKLALELQQLHKKVKELKTDCVRKHDKWGQNFRAPLLAACMQFSTAQEIANSNAVCTGWRLPQHLEDRLMKPLYVADFTIRTAEHPNISPAEDTAWRIRYSRRKHVDRNFRSGTFRELQMPVPVNTWYRIMYIHHSREVQCLLINNRSNELSLMTLPDFSVVNSKELEFSTQATIGVSPSAITIEEEVTGKVTVYTVPDLVKYDEFYLTVSGFNATRVSGDFYGRSTGFRMVVRSLSRKLDLWSRDVNSTGFEIDNFTNRLFTVCGDFIQMLDLDTGNFLSSYTLKSYPVTLTVRPSSRYLSVYDWGRSAMHFFDTKGDKLTFDEQVSLPDCASHRFKLTSTFTWEVCGRCSSDQQVHFWDLMARAPIPDIPAVSQYGDMYFLSDLFAQVGGSTLLDFTVGLS